MSIVVNPYEGVDMSNIADPNNTGNPPKWEGHIHPKSGRDPMHTSHGVIDYLAGEGEDTHGRTVTESYSVFGPSTSGAFPWENPPNGDDSRNPETLGVIAVPVYETHFGTHTYAFFTTTETSDIRGSRDNPGRAGVPDKLGDTLRQPFGAEGFPEPLVGIAHVGRYVSSEITAREYELFRFNVGRMASKDEPMLLGIGREVAFPHNQERDLLDKILTEFAPDYLPLLTTHDDPGGTEMYETGVGLDRRYVSVLVDDADFDPSEQDDSRASARQRMAQGATFCHARGQWDEDTESAPEPPMPTDIGVDDDTPFVESNASTQEWITADGESAGAGETPDMGDASKYVRCELWNSDSSALTLTQAWGVAP